MGGYRPDYVTPLFASGHTAEAMPVPPFEHAGIVYILSPRLLQRSTWTRPDNPRPDGPLPALLGALCLDPGPRTLVGTELWVCGDIHRHVFSHSVSPEWDSSPLLWWSIGIM